MVSSWTNDPTHSTFTLTVVNPANTTASVFLPTTNNIGNITESGLYATNAPGIFYYYMTNQPGFTNGATVFQVGSGTYRFKVTGVNL